MDKKNSHYYKNRKKDYNSYQNDFSINEALNYSKNNLNNKENIYFSVNRKNMTIDLYNNSKFHNNFGSTNNLIPNINNNSFNSYKSSFGIIENKKNNFLNYKDINRLKYNIKNLSDDEINNLPITLYNELKELYDLLYIKIFSK